MMSSSCPVPFFFLFFFLYFFLTWLAGTLTLNQYYLFFSFFLSFFSSFFSSFVLFFLFGAGRLVFFFNRQGRCMCEIIIRAPIGRNVPLGSEKEKNTTDNASDCI